MSQAHTRRSVDSKRLFPVGKILVALALFVTACTSESPPAEQASELIFAGEAPTPTVVPAAEDTEVETAADVDAEDLPPSPLAFTQWTIDNVIDRLDAAGDRPTTFEFAGNGQETLHIDGTSWAVTSSSAGSLFTTRGEGDEQWVTYAHVEAGVLAAQAFGVGTTGRDIDELLASPDALNNTQTLRLLADRSIFTETADLATMWVPHDANEAAFFSPTVLTPGVVADIVSDVTTALAAGDAEGTLEIEASEQGFETSVPNTEFDSLAVGNDGAITLASQAGWTLRIVDDIDSQIETGAPDVRDILSRDLLLTATSAPSECIAPELEARTVVENGLVVCTGLDQLRAIVQTPTEIFDQDE